MTARAGIETNLGHQFPCPTTIKIWGCTHMRRAGTGAPAELDTRWYHHQPLRLTTPSSSTSTGRYHRFPRLQFFPPYFSIVHLCERVCLRVWRFQSSGAKEACISPNFKKVGNHSATDGVRKRKQAGWITRWMHLGTIPHGRLDSQSGHFLIACPSVVFEDLLARHCTTVRHIFPDTSNQDRIEQST